jgi:hypothetical protein
MKLRFDLDGVLRVQLDDSEPNGPLLCLDDLGDHGFAISHFADGQTPEREIFASKSLPETLRAFADFLEKGVPT